MSSSDFSTPIKRKRIQVLKNTIVCQKRKIQTLQQSVQRLKSRVTSLKKLLKQKSSCLQENCETPIKAPLPEGRLMVFLRECRTDTEIKNIHQDLDLLLLL